MIQTKSRSWLRRRLNISLYVDDEWYQQALWHQVIVRREIVNK